MVAETPIPDWQPLSLAVQENQVAAYDAQRERCPVAFSDALQWSFLAHDDVCRALEDHATFSNAVSKNAGVPNGNDPPDHAVYRKAIEPHLGPERIAWFTPICQAIAADQVAAAVAADEDDLMKTLARPFAVRTQCAFLGWPDSWHAPLIDWSEASARATRQSDGAALATVASAFEDFIADAIRTRHDAEAGPNADVTAALMHEIVWGRPLSQREITGILRNWTAGEIGTISAAIGIIVQFLVERPDIQRQLRREPDHLPAAIDEILRLHNPLRSNRRITTCPVKVGGRDIPAQARITLNWIAANRDPAAFDDPSQFRLDRSPDKNLLFGKGIHACPGAALSRLELLEVVRALFAQTADLQPTERRPTHASYPGAGFSDLPIRCLPS